MSPARLTSYNIVRPGNPGPSEGQRDGSLGPGWSWVAFFRPWAAGRPSPRYRWTLFDTVDHALDDLLRCLDDGTIGERGALCSSVLRTRRAPRELVLCDGANWACVVHEVRTGVHVTDAGDACFARWRAAMDGHRFEILNAGSPTVW